MDVFSRAKRSQIMSRVGGKNTKPEIAVRSLLHSLGYRFRLHRKDLPGKPDITLPKYKKVIFVHGCFWHGHEDCPRAKRPSTNEEFWREKLDKNIERDKETVTALKELGWDVLTVWTCEVKDTNKLKTKLLSFLGW
ncbi:MAG: DNA mismatch endonuclease Vsr [Deltaproteobacteria bacterium]|nr:DNA mismatch endonuclease Vsr [Deltaproteobacteria bacterium]